MAPERRWRDDDRYRPDDDDRSRQGEYQDESRDSPRWRGEYGREGVGPSRYGREGAFGRERYGGGEGRERYGGYGREGYGGEGYGGYRREGYRGYGPEPYG